MKGRSFCPHCRKKLGFLDLIPVLSFILLKGRCRYCKERISIQYPSVELAAGFLFVLNFLMSELPPNIVEVGTLILIPFLIIIFVYDLKHYIIPDKVVYPAIGIALVYDFWMSWMSDIPRMSDILISSFGTAGFFLAIALISRGKWMGVGDIKLAFLMGLILGWPNILAALFLAFLIGAIIGVGLIIFGKKTIKSEVPFGPFLVTGTFIALFWGTKIINWYVQSFYFN